MTSSEEEEMKENQSTVRDVKRVNFVVESLIEDIDCNLSRSERDSSPDVNRFILSKKKRSKIPEKSTKKYKEMDFEFTLRKVMADDRRRSNAKKYPGDVVKSPPRMKRKIKAVRKKKVTVVEKLDEEEEEQEDSAKIPTEYRNVKECSAKLKKSKCSAKKDSSSDKLSESSDEREEVPKKKKGRITTDLCREKETLARKNKCSVSAKKGHVYDKMPSSSDERPQVRKKKKKARTGNCEREETNI